MSEATRQLRFALLGDMPQTSSALAEAIQNSSRHQIVAALTSNFPGVPYYDHWQPLLSAEQFDAVLLFAPAEELCEAARQLALRGKTVVVDANCTLPSALVSEFGLLDAEGTANIVPLFEYRAVPVFCELRQRITAGAIGQVTTVDNERALKLPSSDVGGRVLTEDLIQSLEMAHIDLLRWLGGGYSQVTLLRKGATDRGFVSQMLTLSGEGLPDATCTYQIGNSDRWTCHVTGTHGSATVETANGGSELRINGETVQTPRECQADQELSLRLVDESIERLPGALRWQDRVRVHEIQEAMQRSLRRRRTIDLHFETTSERSQFKTQMATVGCFVLVYTFFASVLLLLAGAVLDPRDQLQRQAEAAGFVLTRSEFEPSNRALTPQGVQHVQEIADRWQGAGAVVVIAAGPLNGDDESNESAADRMRLAAVREQLHDSGTQRVKERTVIKRLAGQGFQRLMSAGRVIAFAPLGVCLLLQLLLLIARPARGLSTANHANSANQLR